MMKKLPIGTQSFSILRSTDCLYVDKTEYIYRMVTTGRVYFLSRPRCFGKSLLVSTLDALFKGQKELFEGLYIYDKWNWNEQYPVIRLDFGERTYDTPEKLESSLFTFINEMAENYSVNLVSPDLSDRFGELIKRLHKSTGQQVVVLIDEYDKPITDHLSDPKVMTANKTTLHNFYQVLKATDEHLYFIFLTGVSKFAGVSVFSALNNPDDITKEDQYASICGYTQEELESYFSDYINRAAKYNNMNRRDLLDKIRTWYNGYSWDGETSVYNPFSTLSFFKKMIFDDYWFRTGTPGFLIELLKRRNQLQPIFEPIRVGSSIFDGYEPENISEISLLFQTGYLTVKQRDKSQNRVQYILELPNEEVKESFLEYLLNAYSSYPKEQIQPLITDMQRQIFNKDTSGIEKNLRMLLANIPNIIQIQQEGYYHSLFLTWMKMLGFEIQGEILTNIGRIDAVWRQPGLTVIAEVKYSADKNIDSLLDEAMTQIHDRQYYEAFLGEKIMLMGVAFAGKEVKCRLELLES
ncbi:MAG: ATP-binding protein [Prevotellaceae bacterium]|jgi:hypothetical protein|nr:ATP-binding protein [Prevotellaceae bacterium]